MSYTQPQTVLPWSLPLAIRHKLSPIHSSISTQVFQVSSHLVPRLGNLTRFKSPAPPFNQPQTVLTWTAPPTYQPQLFVTLVCTNLVLASNCPSLVCKPSFSYRLVCTPDYQPQTVLPSSVPYPWLSATN